jgi:hypothetical protein
VRTLRVCSFGPVWSGGAAARLRAQPSVLGNDRFRLNAASSKGGIARPLTQGPFDVMPSVSPDGTRIAFTRLVASVVSPAISLFTVNARGQRPAQLLGGGFDLSPAWSPDGTAIVFSRLASDTAPIEEAELFLAAANGSNVRPLGEGVRGVSRPGVVLPKEGHWPWLMAMPAAGGRAVRIGRFAGVLDPAWSPAGIG